MKDSFIFYNSFLKGVESLEDEHEQHEAVMAILYYALRGEEKEIKGAARGIFEMARPQIDANKDRYENGKKGGKYGKLGGRPKKVQEAPKEEKPKKPKAEKPAKVEEPKLSYGEYGNVKLTAAEHDKLVEKYGSEETKAAIEFFDQYITEKGYKSKSHYLAMCRWVFDAVTEKKAKKSTAINESPIDQYFRERGLMA